MTPDGEQEEAPEPPPEPFGTEIVEESDETERGDLPLEDWDA
jgi:hypothetical protein